MNYFNHLNKNLQRLKNLKIPTCIPKLKLLKMRFPASLNVIYLMHSKIIIKIQLFLCPN